MINFLLKNIGLSVLGVSLLCGAIEIRQGIETYANRLTGIEKKINRATAYTEQYMAALPVKAGAK